MNAWTGLVVTAAVVSVVGSGVSPRAAADRASHRSPGGRLTAGAGRIHRQLRSRPVRAVRCRRHRLGRRPAHRHQRDRRSGPLHVRRAAGGRLPRSRPPHRATSRPAACSCWPDLAPTPPGRSSSSRSLPRAVDPRQRAAKSQAILAAGFVGSDRARAGRARRRRRGRGVARPLRSGLAAEAPEAQRAEGGDRSGHLRRGRRSGGVRSRCRRHVHAADRPGASRGQPAQPLPAGRPGQPADDRRLRQPAAAGVGRIAGARRRDGLARRVGRLARRLGGPGRDDAGRRRLVDGLGVVPDAGAGAGTCYDVGMSYSLQRYDGSNPSALAAVSDGNRYAGIGVRDRLVVDQRPRLAGLRRAVREVRLHREVPAQPACATDGRAGRHRCASASARRGARWRRAPKSSCRRWSRARGCRRSGRLRRSRAPRSCPSARGTWTSRSSTTSRSRRWSASARSRSDTKDQIVTLFGMGALERETSDLGHYWVGTAGDVDARGYTVSIRQVIARRVRGSVDYTVTTAEWHETPTSDAARATAARAGAHRHRAAARRDDDDRSGRADHRDARVRALSDQHRLRRRSTRGPRDRRRTRASTSRSRSRCRS